MFAADVVEVANKKYQTYVPVTDVAPNSDPADLQRLKESIYGLIEIQAAEGKYCIGGRVHVNAPGWAFVRNGVFDDVRGIELLAVHRWLVDHLIADGFKVFQGFEKEEDLDLPDNKLPYVEIFW